MGTIWRRAPSISGHQTYEQYAVSTAVDLIKEIISVLERIPADGPEQERKRRFNVSRAYAAIDDLRRIDL